jgi:hypothetical protein
MTQSGSETRSAKREWSVGELAEAAGVTVRTLHHYDQVGLLAPAARTGAGHRRYRVADADSPESPVTAPSCALSSSSSPPAESVVVNRVVVVVTPAARLISIDKCSPCPFAGYSRQYLGAGRRQTSIWDKYITTLAS